MSAKRFGMFRRPVTLSQLKAIAAIKADAKTGELLIDPRTRVIPNAWDDQQFGDYIQVEEKYITNRIRQQAEWDSWCELWNRPKFEPKIRFDSKAKILRLERRRQARKNALDRKTYWSGLSGYEECTCDIERETYWEILSDNEVPYVCE